MPTQRERVEAAFRKRLDWIEDEKQQAAWLKTWMDIYELGVAAAAGAAYQQDKTIEEHRMQLVTRRDMGDARKLVEVLSAQFFDGDHDFDFSGFVHDVAQAIADGRRETAASEPL